MNAELEAIADAMDKTTGAGRDTDTACSLADAYVAAHPEQFAGFDTLSLETELVPWVDAARAAGDTDRLLTVQTWILHHYEFQNIGGTYQPQLRIPTP